MNDLYHGDEPYVEYARRYEDDMRPYEDDEYEQWRAENDMLTTNMTQTIREG